MLDFAVTAERAQIQRLLTYVHVHVGTTEQTANQVWSWREFGITPKTITPHVFLVAKDHEISNAKMTWKNARSYCQSIGGDLSSWGMRDPVIRK